jgi:hypothetical protein
MSKKLIVNSYGTIECPMCNCEYTHILSVDIDADNSDVEVTSSGRKVDVSKIDVMHGGADAVVRIGMYCESCGSIDVEFDDDGFEKQIDEHKVVENFYIEFKHHKGTTDLDVN